MTNPRNVVYYGHHLEASIVPIVLTNPLKVLLRRATPQQIRAARVKTIDYLSACRLDDIQPEACEKVMRESLEVLLAGDDEQVEYDDRALFEARNYGEVYAGGYNVGDD
jgi:hypothetical protein